MMVKISTVLRMLIGIRYVSIGDYIFEYRTYDDIIDAVGYLSEEECLGIRYTDPDTVELITRDLHVLIL